MITILENIHVALPEIIILASACLALLADLFLRQCVKGAAFYVSCAGLLVAAIVSYLFIGNFKLLILNGMFISDDVGHLMKFFIYLTVLLSFIYSRQYLEERQMPQGDYYVWVYFQL